MNFTFYEDITNAIFSFFRSLTNIYFITSGVIVKMTF